MRKVTEARPALRQLIGTARSTEELLHELQVYQIELEMQNQELRRTQLVIEKMRDRYVDLYELAPVGHLTLNRDGLIIELNLTGAEMMGVERSKMINRHFSSFVCSGNADRWYLHFRDILQRDGRQQCELAMQHSDGSYLQVNVTSLKSADLLSSRTIDQLSNPDDPLNTSVQLRIVLTDITERIVAETELRIAASAFETQESLMITDPNGIILRVNKAFTETTGYSAEEAIGRYPSMLTSGHHDGDFYRSMWEIIHATGTWQGEIWDRRKNGEIYPKWLTISAVKGDNDIVTHYVGAHSDITERKRAEEEIKHLAFYDHLTGLPNRRLLQDRLQHALASSERRGRAGALMFIDLDNFKTLNDTLGHDIGDKLLQQVAKRLELCVREGDTVARLGGDEYVILLEDLSLELLEAAAQAEAIGEKILFSLNQKYILATHEYYNSPSIGVTLFIGHEYVSEDLFKHADLAMYQAKKSGRNTLRFFDPEMQKSIDSRSSIEGQLRKALENKEFQLYYQIQVDSSGNPVGAEALIRWIHPERGMVSPAQFIPLAEESGLIVSIGGWVLDTACAQILTWQKSKQTSNLILSVNVSSKQFRQVNFVNEVQNAIQRHGIKPNLLKLELTESLLLDKIEEAIATMKSLKAIGVRISLDDFGTGYSSLQYLKRLPLDQLKIDQSFVRDIAIDESDKAIVQTIIVMAKSLKLEVIAEGVETDEQRHFLESAGCVHYQGYLFGKPMPIEQLEAFLYKN